MLHNENNLSGGGFFRRLRELTQTPIPENGDFGSTSMLHPRPLVEGYSVAHLPPSRGIQLTAKQKHSLELVESGLTHEQAATLLGINRVTFTQRVNRARALQDQINRLVEAHLEGR